MQASYSLSSTTASLRSSVEFQRRALSLLGPQALRRAFAGDVKRERTYHSVALFLTFLGQVLHRCSCERAVAYGTFGGWLDAKACPHNSAYCNARLRMSETALKDLMIESGRKLMDQERTHGFGRPVRVVDGSSVQLADTSANQDEYPQPLAQSPGCGFPVLQFVGVMDLDSGALLNVAHGDLHTNERTLFRELWDTLAPGDIVLADRGFDAYADSALLQQRGIDTLFRLNAHRKIDLSRAQRLGSHEWLIELPAPIQEPDWIGGQTLPSTLQLRLIEVKMPRNCRVKGPIRLVTTLLDRKRFPKSQLALMYRRRWEMELNLRHIKTTLGLELIQAKSPATCRKHLWMGLLAYNLIRHLMGSAAQAAKIALKRISFHAAWSYLRLWLAAPGRKKSETLARAIRQLGQIPLPDRATRHQPRRVKRRPKNYPPLYHSRKKTLQWDRDRTRH